MVMAFRHRVRSYAVATSIVMSLVVAVAVQRGNLPGDVRDPDIAELLAGTQFLEGEFSLDMVGKIRLGYKHMSKCGGVFLNNLLRDVVKVHHFYPEETGLTHERTHDVFVIASTRNPCDYYVSLWAYQHDKWFSGEQNEKHDFFDFGKPHENATKFREWLAWVQGPQFSVMSVRFWETLVAQKDGLSCWADSLGSCTKNTNDGAVERDLAHFDPFDTVDCWLYTETLMSDLRRCLSQYEKLSGVPVDWSVLDSVEDLNHNPSDHPTCEHFFTPEAADSVMTTDRHMFEKFGYSQCCGPPSNPLREVA
jgi:hypothetical protein